MPVFIFVLLRSSTSSPATCAKLLWQARVPDSMHLYYLNTSSCCDYIAALSYIIFDIKLISFLARARRESQKLSLIATANGAAACRSPCLKTVRQTVLHSMQLN